MSSAGSSHLTETLLGCTVAPPVPEEPINPESALGCGYGESKWVGEQMLFDVAARTNVPIQIVRLAQICGDRNGYWNDAEWFPAMVKSASLTRCLPDIDGVRCLDGVSCYVISILTD